MLICKPLLVEFFLTDFNGIVTGNRPNFLYSIHRHLFKIFYDLELVVKNTKKSPISIFLFIHYTINIKKAIFRSFFQKNSSNGYVM